MALSKDQIKELIARRHPYYQDAAGHWGFCEQSYRGGRGYINKSNVFKFYKEGDSEFANRLTRTHRINHTRRVVDTLNQYLFKQRPIRAGDVPPALTKFWEGVTQRGQTMDAFAKEVSRWLSVFGIVYVVVDRTRELVAARADEETPYVYLVFPTHVLDIGYDRRGRVSWCLIAEDFIDDSDPYGSSGAVRVRYRLWERDKWTLITPLDDKAEDFRVETDVNSLGEVPVVPVVEPNAQRYAPTGLIDDIVYMDRSLVNYGALLDEIIYEQTFSQLVMPVEGILPGSRDENAVVAAAKKRIFTYQGGEANAPQYISPDASQATVIAGAMQTLTRQIYAITGTDSGDANTQSMSKGREYASGVVRSMDHASLENMLLNRAQALEAAEDDVARLVLLWMGQDIEMDPDWVRYPERFDVRGLATDLEIATELTNINAPEGVQRRHMKGLAEKLFPRMSKDEGDILAAEIDKWETKPKPPMPAPAPGDESEDDEDDDEDDNENG